MSVEHRTLRIEREYPHPRSLVFAAWANPVVKRQWFTFSVVDGEKWHSDFRPGGVEYYRSAPNATPRVAYDARFGDITADERIIVTSEVTIDARRTSVALSTAEFESVHAGTRLTITEQLAFLDGLETEESRIGGIRNQLENLGSVLSRPA